MTYTTSILVVEDAQGMRDTLYAILADEGHHVAFAGNAADAIELIGVSSTDIVISDLNLPDGSGLEILPALNRINPDAAFIVITGHTSLETAMQALNQGAFAYHVKPLDIDALLGSIRNAQKQQRLATENRELLRGLEQANEQLHLARDAALEASQAKLYFLASMSHEIRTPMNAIVGMADLLSETPLTTEQQEYVDTFRRAGDNLLEIIDDILDLSKVEAGQLNLEEIDFDLLELVEHSATFLAARAHGKGLELNCRVAPDVPTALVGDPVRLRQVLTNLIGNAIKFTHAGEVFLQVENLGGTDDIGSLIFRVSDNGIGIPPEKLDYIFDRFTQVDSSTTREYGGTGLGLNICRRLIAMMDGLIWVDSKVGEGSTFYFTARFGVQSDTDRSAEGFEEDLKELTALVIDDNATNRWIITEKLVGWGASVVAVEDAKQALLELDRARNNGVPYQAVVVDHRMPGMNGFQMVENMGECPNIADIIMLLTADTRSADIDRCRELVLLCYMRFKDRLSFGWRLQ